MSSSSLVRFGGGLASAAAGILLLLGHVLNLGGDPEYGTVPGASSVLVAHIILVFALVALYAAQADESGLLGSLVHLQDRFRVASYSKVHENSNLCTFILRRGA